MKVFRYLFASIVSATFFVNYASGQSFKSVFVFSEDDDPDSRKCQTSSQSVESAAESALRFNRISISTNRSTEVKLHISPVVLSLTERFCAANVRITFLKYAPTAISESQKPIWASHVFCTRSTLFAYDRNEIQNRINLKVKQMVDECISEIEKN
jgi:hypothetical protein